MVVSSVPVMSRSAAIPQPPAAGAAALADAVAGMPRGSDVTRLGVLDTLDAVDVLYAARVEAEAATFELVAHVADLHGPGSRPVDPGDRHGERCVQVGGAGTPAVAEFVCAELGGRLRVGSWTARRLLADVLDVRHRLPRCWSRVLAREARIASVRLVAARTRHLSVEAALEVDRSMVDVVDGSLPWSRFEARLEGRIKAADPAVAAAREAEEATRQVARRTRADRDGMAGFYVRSTAGVVARVEATVRYVAGALAAFGDLDAEEERRVKALVLLCNPTWAVELLAAYAALRSRSAPGLDAGHPLPEPPGRTDPPSASRASDVLDRVDDFARRVGFAPTRLPAWLSARPPSDGGLEPVPAFRFAWPELLPPLTMYLHFSVDEPPPPQPCRRCAEDSGSGAGPATPGTDPDPGSPVASGRRAAGSQVVRWEGVGPVTRQFVDEQLRPLHRYVVTPVVDLAGQAPVDAYEIPDRHRRALRLRTPADCFPWGGDLTGRRSDVDHTRPHAPAATSGSAQVGGPGSGGQVGGPAGGIEKAFLSRMDNYGPLGRFHHRIKTHGSWTVRQPFAGIYLWRDPHGQVYLCDHTGTHKVTSPGTAAGPATGTDARGEPEIEVVPSPDVRLVWSGR